MIRSIEEEKKKMNRRRNDDFSGGMTEEALMELIRQVETEEMLHAPGNLKANVFEQLRRERHTAKKRQIFTYRAKVLTAMAAALAVLIFMPSDRAEKVSEVSVQQQTELEQMAQRRQQSKDDDWEKYQATRERGGMRGFFHEINEAVTQFGASLYENIGG